MTEKKKKAYHISQLVVGQGPSNRPEGLREVVFVPRAEGVPILLLLLAVPREIEFNNCKKSE